MFISDIVLRSLSTLFSRRMTLDNRILREGSDLIRIHNRLDEVRELLVQTRVFLPLIFGTSYAHDPDISLSKKSQHKVISCCLPSPNSRFGFELVA